MTDTEAVTPSLSYSSLDLHRQCPQAWNYKHVRRLEQDSSEPAVDREMGNWWHALRAADAITRGLALGSLLAPPEKVRTGTGGPEFLRMGRVDDTPRYRVEGVKGRAPLTAELILDAAAVFWKRLTAEEQEVWIERLGGTLVDRLEWLDDRWQARWAEETRFEAPLGVEVKFQIKLPGTEQVMTGYIDEVYEETQRGIVVVRDNKSKRTLDTTTVAEDLMDSQLHDYAWGITPTVKKWGKKVQAVAYDRVRVSPPKSPSVTQSGALSQSVKDYDLQTYLDFVGDGVPWGEEGKHFASGPRKGEPKWGIYTAEESVIERLSRPDWLSVWHQRTLVPLNRHVIKAHVLAAGDTYLDTERTLERIEKNGAAARNFTRWGCRHCDFAALCRAEMMGGPDGEYPLADYGLRHRDD